VSVRPVPEGRGVLRTALARAGTFLLEAAEAPDAARAAPAEARPVVLVVGLSPGCGTTTVSRALAAVLAGRDPSGAAIVCGSASASPLALATAPARRLARSLEPVAGTAARTAGRLCVVAGDDAPGLARASRYVAPLVLDAGSRAPEPAELAIAGTVVLAAAGDAEPSLVEVVSSSFGRSGPEPIMVVSRAAEPERWADRAVLLLSDSRAGASLALGGREPPGELGREIAALADLCAAP